jgi:hypothetical protein
MGDSHCCLLTHLVTRPKIIERSRCRLPVAYGSRATSLSIARQVNKQESGKLTQNQGRLPNRVAYWWYQEYADAFDDNISKTMSGICTHLNVATKVLGVQPRDRQSEAQSRHRIHGRCKEKRLEVNGKALNLFVKKIGKYWKSSNILENIGRNC